MQLRVEGNMLTKDFGTWLLDLVKLELKASFNKKKLQSLSSYIDQDVNIPVETFINKVLDSLVCTIEEEDKVISIHIDKNSYLVGNIKLDTMCRAINFGTATQKGYPVFTDVFHSIVSKINNYVTLYKLTGGANE